MVRTTYRLLSGSVHGVKHARLGTNNQDAAMSLEFSVPKWERTYRIGLVSDGCSGIPAFTFSEVGAHLQVVFCLARIQELILGGTPVEDIPTPLYHAVTSFLRDLAFTVMPSTIYWPYPMTFKGTHEFRNQQKAPQRFMGDYLAATILGFVDDGETLVTFQAGDGVIIINDEVLVTDQNDRPDYPVLAVSSPGAGFVTSVYSSHEVERLALATDGVEDLLTTPGLAMPDLLFMGAQGKPMALQYLLNRLRKQYPTQVSDDCTVLTRERFSEEVTDGEPIHD